ncbi:efflux RND transporter periplasmic adaptor subunit [Oceanicoccus sp. KOV_DT_Chl]|uniref:efflux RND transporter periplasmic adaptor subunit n=1 Tax=Oceanicoccus sp. KOV_DT_Chl TaxID=1904639 RepID=UPI000C7A2F18|nr:efflux RND transporter periplasmic adaptor subunit [Oceanicoccus sp. KOV_DT_Chl]
MTRRTSVVISLLSLAITPLIMTLAHATDKGAPVEVVAPQQRNIFQSVQLTGTVTSPQTATLSVATSGLVAAVHAEEGSQVQAGDLLLEVDAKLAQLQLESVIAKKSQASIALQDSQRRLEEARILIPNKSIAESTVRELEAEVAASQAVLQQAVADKAYQQELINRHQLKAPFAGVVSQKLTEQGEWLAPGAGVFELVGTENARIDFYVAENYLAKLNQDTAISFNLNVDPNKVYQGRIGAIVPVLDPAARTFLLRVLVDSTAGNIIPGMSVSALLQVPTDRQGIVVPKDALLRHRDGRVIIWAIEQRNGESFTVERLVETGVAFDGFIEIRQGLTLGEQVVVRGNEALQNGQKVMLINHNSSGQ